MFKVLQDGKDATSISYSWPPGKGWNSCIFNSFEEAVCYAVNWCNFDPGFTRENPRIDITGYGNFVEIREI